MLTPKQELVLNFLKKFYKTNGHMPTLHETARALNIKSLSTIHQHIRWLIDKGYIEQPGDYGALQLNSPNANMVPILGTIAAGSPILAIEEDDPQTITIENLPSLSNFYALRVAGDSMIDEGIFDGDVVVIKRQDYANDGQTVVAIIDKDKATLKKIYREKRGYRLQPANQAMLPIFTKELQIRGIVWEIRRAFNDDPAFSSGEREKAWRTLDLFAGIGGIRLGFERAGFRTVFANDFEAPCKNTYDTNFKDSKLIVEDITRIRAKDLPDFDFLLAGFPCQAFSVAGYRQGFSDEKGRGNLFFDIARIIEARKPEGFLLENVKNLKNHDGGKTFSVIKKTLKDLGYEVKVKVLNSMEYGNVPQNRERIYIVGFKDPSKLDAFEFPDPKPLTKSVIDVLEKKVDEKYYYNGKPLFEKLKDEVNEIGQVYQWRRQYVRKNKRGVCPTLTANMGMGGHNVPIIFDGKGIRKLTPRECARIQGFPDTFKLPSDLPDSKLYKQIGNSVTVPVVSRIAERLQLVL